MTQAQDRIHCAVVQDEAGMRDVFRLRYACYRRSGAIAPRPDEQFSDPFDRSPNQFSFLFRAQETPVATVRVSVVRPDLGWVEAPARSVYGDHPAFAPIVDGAFVEASRLCFAHQARRDAFVRVVANMAALAEVYGVGWLIACPRVEHCRAYERLFGFRKLAEPRRYFGVNFETQLLGIRTRELRSFVEPRRAIRIAWAEALLDLACAAYS